jgi:hypothetical protein
LGVELLQGAPRGTVDFRGGCTQDGVRVNEHGSSQQESQECQLKAAISHDRVLDFKQFVFGEPGTKPGTAVSHALRVTRNHEKAAGGAGFQLEA